MPRVLMISPTPTHPEGAGNRARVASIAALLQQAGCAVHFLHLNREPGDLEAMRAFFRGHLTVHDYHERQTLGRRVRRFWNRLWHRNGIVNYHIDDWWDDSADECIRALHEKWRFDAVIVEYVFFSRALRVLDGDIVKLIDTHDMFAGRHRRYLEQGEKPQWFSTTARQESLGLNRADFVLAISEAEANDFRTRTRATVLTIGHITNCTRRNPAIVQEKTLLFVGSANPINQQGAKWFIVEILPLIRAKHPEAVLRVAGGVAGHLSPQPGLELLGHVDDLAMLYATTAVVINPVRFMTGLSIKNLEALAASCPLVTTSAAVKAFDRRVLQVCRVADDAVEFAHQVNALLADSHGAIRLGIAASDMVLSWNTVARQRLLAAVGLRPELSDDSGN